MLGYSQILGLDYIDNFVPVINDVTFRIIMMMALVKGWNADVMDMETTFLYGNLEEEIFMKFLEGYKSLREGGDDECLALQKALYGLMQVGGQWWKKFVWTLIQLGFSKCGTDVCLLIRIDKNDMVIFFIFINNLQCMGQKKVIDISWCS